MKLWEVFCVPFQKADADFEASSSGRRVQLLMVKAWFLFSILQSLIGAVKQFFNLFIVELAQAFKLFGLTILL